MEYAVSSGLAQTNLQLLGQLRGANADPPAILQIRRDYETACLLFGDLMRHSGKPSLCHMVGTASALVAEGAPFAVIRAGLLHTAYSHGRFPTGRKGAEQRHRRWLVERSDEEVEAIVFAYFRFRFDDAAVDRALADPESLEDLERTLLLMRLCNEVDECIDYSLSLDRQSRYDDPNWLDKTRRLAVALGHDFCARSLAVAQEEAAPGTSPTAHETFRHDYHRPTVLRFVKQALKKRGAWPRKRRA